MDKKRECSAEIYDSVPRGSPCAIRFHLPLDVTQKSLADEMQSFLLRLKLAVSYTLISGEWT